MPILTPSLLLFFHVEEYRLILIPCLPCDTQPRTDLAAHAYVPIHDTISSLIFVVSQKLILTLLLDVAKGMERIHSKNVIHGDLK
jgi:hypothetical protein